MIFTAFVITLFTIGITLFLEYGMPYIPISPFRKLVKDRPSDYGLRFKPLIVKGVRAVILRGYFIEALTVKARATIIVLHGIGSAKEVYFGFARWLAEQGFNVVVYDQRAHGKSGGQYCTFGFYEKDDVSKFVDIAVAKYPDLPVGIHGASLGGAVALQALEHDKRLKFGIIESTFNTLENVVIEYGRGYFKFRSRWLAKRVLTKSADIARFKPFDIKPIESCRNIEQPILMVHGDLDEKIPMEFNKENYGALKSADKEFYEVKGAGHNNVGEIGGDAYLKKMMTFLNRQVKHILKPTN